MVRANRKTAFYLVHTQIFIHLLNYADDQQLITLELYNGIVRFWNPLTGDCVSQQEIADVGSCYYSPDRRLMATGSKDGLLHLWDRSSGVFEEVFRSVVGRCLTIRWIRGAEYTYLTTFGLSAVRVWKLVENDSNKFELRLLWSLGEKELFLADTNLTGVVALGPGDIELVKQRGALSS